MYGVSKVPSLRIASDPCWHHGAVTVRGFDSVQGTLPTVKLSRIPRENKSHLDRGTFDYGQRRPS